MTKIHIEKGGSRTVPADAGERSGNTLKRQFKGLIEPEGFFGAEELSFSHILKYREILSPEQMASDIEFRPAPGMEEYREHIIQW